MTDDRNDDKIAQTIVVEKLDTAIKDLHSNFIDLQTGQPPSIEEQARRLLVSTSSVKFAAINIGKTNRLASILGTIYTINQINTNQPITPLILDQKFWNWVRTFVTTLNGERINVSEEITKIQERNKDKNVTKPKRIRKTKAELKMSDEEFKQNRIKKDQEYKQKIAEKEQERQAKKQKTITELNDQISTQEEKQLVLMEKHLEQVLRNNEQAADSFVSKLNSSEVKIKSLKRKLDALENPATPNTTKKPPSLTTEQQGLQDIKILTDLNNAFEIMATQMDLTTFVWPDRANLTKIYSAESNKYFKSVKLLYSAELIESRMKRVIKQQIIKEFKDFDTNIINKDVKHHFYMWISKQITNKHEYPGYDMIKKPWFINLTNLPNFETLIKPKVESIIDWHLDRMPNTSDHNNIQWSFTESIHANIQHVIPYISHLSLYLQDQSKRTFPILPQVSMQIPFIDIGPDALYNLVNLTYTDSFREFYLQELSRLNLDLFSESAADDNPPVSRTSRQQRKNKRKIHQLTLKKNKLQIEKIRLCSIAPNEIGYIPSAIYIKNKKNQIHNQITKINRKLKKYTIHPNIIKTVVKNERCESLQNCHMDWVLISRDHVYLDPTQFETNRAKDTQTWFRYLSQDHMRRFVRFPDDNQDLYYNKLNPRKAAHTYTTTVTSNSKEIHFHKIRRPVLTEKDHEENKESTDKSANKAKRRKVHQDSETINLFDGELKPNEIGTEEQLYNYITKEIYSNTQLNLRNKIMIAVDPGHKNNISMVAKPLISAEKEAQYKQQRMDRFVQQISNNGKSRKFKRKLRKKLQQAASNEREYELTNQRYYDLAGFTQRRLKLQYWKKQDGINELDSKLGSNGGSCRTFDRGKYLTYVKNALDTDLWNKYWSFVSKSSHLKLRFTTYQKRQRAYFQIAHEMCFWKKGELTSFLDGNTNNNNNRDTQYSNSKENRFYNGASSLSFNNFIIIWGNGSFGPTTRSGGHAAAPNKSLRIGLSKYLNIYVVDEYNTTKTSSCCRGKSLFPKKYQEQVGCKDLKSLVKTEYDLKCLSRVGWKHRDFCYCSECNKPWKRDTNSAINIWNRFRDRLFTGMVPECFRYAEQEED